MNEVVTLDRLAVEIRFYSQQTAQNIIEVGKRLIEAKKQVPHGEWKEWLDKQVSFSRRTADRFMQCAERFANSPTSANLNLAQMTELLTLPESETQDFIKAKAAEGKPVEDMTVRTLREEVKAWKGKALEMERKQNETYGNQLLAEQEVASLRSQLQLAKENPGGEAQKRIEELMEERDAAIEARDTMEQERNATAASNLQMEDDLDRMNRRIRALDQARSRLVGEYADLQEENRELRLELDRKGKARAKELVREGNVSELVIKRIEREHALCQTIARLVDAVQGLPKKKERQDAIQFYLDRNPGITLAMVNEAMDSLDALAEAMKRAKGGEST